MRRIVGAVALVLVLAGCGSEPSATPASSQGAGDDVTTCNQLVKAWGDFVRGPSLAPLDSSPDAVDWPRVGSDAKSLLAEQTPTVDSLADATTGRLWGSWVTAGQTMIDGIAAGDQGDAASRKLTAWLRASQSAVGACSDLLRRSTTGG